jgi:excisionase family DNA binding protein
MEDIQILTVEEAAQQMRVSQDTVRRLLRNNKLPGSRVGGQWRVLAEGLNNITPPQSRALGGLIGQRIVTLKDHIANGVTIPARTILFIVSHARSVGGCYGETVTARQVLIPGDGQWPDLSLSMAAQGTNWELFIDDGQSSLPVPRPLLKRIKNLLNTAYASTNQADWQRNIELTYLLTRDALGSKERTDDDVISTAIDTALRRLTNSPIS